MKKIECPKKKFAQQLVEFLLVAPFLVIILGILTEYSYALNCNTTLNEGLTQVTSSIYSKITPTMTGDDIKNKVTADLRAYLVANNVPTKAENTLTVARTMVGESAVFVANYKYVSAFTLPNVFFYFLPASFNFQAVSIIPKAFIEGNIGYNGGINSTDLDGIWLGNNFSGVNTYNGVKNGAMKSKLGDNLPILFLVRANPDTTPGIYTIVKWDGTSTNGTPIYDTLNINTGLTSTGVNFLSKYGGIYHNFIFTADQEVRQDWTLLHHYWTHLKGTCVEVPSPSCTPIPAGASIADPIVSGNPVVDGILKRALGAIDTTLNSSGGNYDNINVSQYNPEASPSAPTLFMETYGSAVFLRMAGDPQAVTNITNGQAVPNVNYNFGAKEEDIY